MGIQRSEMTQKQHDQELKQLRELRNLMDGKLMEPYDDTSGAVRSADMGGHMPQKQKDREKDGHIGATNDEVRKLLREYGHKLGVEYVPR